MKTPKPVIDISLFPEVPLTPILTIKDSKRSVKELADLVNTFKMRSLFRVEVSTIHGVTTSGIHVTCFERMISAKQKSVNLFAVALLISTRKGIASRLWAQPFGPFDARGSAEDNATEGVLITPVIQLYLSQAGFKITPTETTACINDTAFLKDLISSSSLQKTG
jgi:hypothetical protein